MSALRTPRRAVGACLAVATLALGACAPRPVTGNDGHAKDVPAATATGPAVSCIPLASIQESRVRDDWTIDFRVSGTKWYRNTLPYRCSNLGFERAFSYETSLSQLCNVDIIRVLPQGGGPRGPMNACGLGTFQPVTLDKDAKK